MVFASLNGTSATLTKLFEKCGMEYSNVSVDQRNEFDKKRVEDGDYGVREDRKGIRKVKLRAICKKQDGFQHLEGVQYQSALFYDKPPSGHKDVFKTS